MYKSYGEKKLKLDSDVGDSGSKKSKRGYGGAYGGVRRSLLALAERKQVQSVSTKIMLIPVNFDGS
jgi:hypothetical protein